MNDFLPKDYEAPKTSNNYMKLEDGDNRIRILSSAIVGSELWVGGKPVRKHKEEEFTPQELSNSDINPYTGERKVPVHFWAMVVWNYAEKKVRILQINQKTIQKPLTNLVKDEDWGSPFGYDIVISKVLVDKKTEYSVTPKPHKALDPEIKKVYEGMQINLEALFNNVDPFKSENVNPDDVKL